MPEPATVAEYIAHPTPSAIRAFEKVLAGYSRSGATIPLDRPLPHSLVTPITKFRVR